MRLLALLLTLSIYPLYLVAQPPTYPRDITLNVTAPSDYVDGTAIDVNDGLTLEATCTRTQDGSLALNRQVFTSAVTPGGNVNEVFSGAIPQPGLYECVVYAVVDAISSDPSNTAQKRFVGQPSPPFLIRFD
jgi:hypothetical protein